MALVLKDGKTFENPFNKTDIDTAYGVIDQVNGNKKDHPNQAF